LEGVYKVSNASADAKAHHHAHPDEFLSQVHKLREAESSAQSVLDEARKSASQVEAAGREKAVEINAKATERAVAAKNDILAKGRQETEVEVRKIIGEAKKQAEKIRSKQLADKDAASISQGVL